MPIAGLTLACATWNSSDGIYRLYTNGAVDTVSAAQPTICGGGVTSRFTSSGYWGGALQSAPTSSTILGSFYTDTALSAARMAAIARAVLADTPTGTKGEVLTFARASAATTGPNGWATTGIPDWSVSMVPNNRPRLTDGGVMVEGDPTTNINPRSEEVDDVGTWTDVAAGAAAPVLNGTAPTSPLSAPYSMPEDYTFAATAGAQSSGRRAAATGCGAVVCTYSYLIMGQGGTSGTIDVCGWGATAACSSCPFVGTSWSICQTTQTIAGTPGVFIGNSSANNGGTARSSARVYVTAAQTETGSRRSTYSPTIAAATTRVTEGTPSLAMTYLTGAACAAVTVQTNSTAPATGTFLSLPVVSANPDIMGRMSVGAPGCYMRNPGTDLLAGSWVSGTNTFLCSTERRTTTNGATATGASVPLLSGGSSFGLGNLSFANSINGIYSGLKYHNAIGACQ